MTYFKIASIDMADGVYSNGAVFTSSIDIEKVINASTCVILYNCMLASTVGYSWPYVCAATAVFKSRNELVFNRTNMPAGKIICRYSGHRMEIL